MILLVVLQSVLLVLKRVTRRAVIHQAPVGHRLDRANLNHQATSQALSRPQDADQALKLEQDVDQARLAPQLAGIRIFAVMLIQMDTRDHARIPAPEATLMVAAEAAPLSVTLAQEMLLVQAV